MFAREKEAGGAWFVRELGNRLKQFMTNLPEENLLLAEILKFVCSMPVRQELDQTQYLEDSMDKTLQDEIHENLARSHALNIEFPLRSIKQDYQSPLAILFPVSAKCEATLQKDPKLQMLVKLARTQGDMTTLSVGFLSGSVNEYFSWHKKEVFNTVILQELARSLAAIFEAKSVVGKLLQVNHACRENDKVFSE